MSVFVEYEGGSEVDGDLVPQHEVVEADELMNKFGFTDQDEEEEVEVETAEVEKEEKKEAAPEKEKEYNQPFARIRILEKREKGYKKTIEENNKRLDRLEQLLLRQNQPQQEEESLPDISDDPLLRIDKRLDQFEKREKDKNELDQKDKELNAQVQNIGRVLQEADHAISQRLPQLEGYDQAGQFLLNSLFERAIDLDEVESEQEAWNQVQIWINETKIAALAKGVNPADQFMGMARYYGWTPTAKPAETKQELKKKDEAREVIKRQREKDKGSRTISAVSGTTAKAAVPYASMKPEDLQAHFRQLKKKGGKSPYRNDPATASVGIEV